LVMVLLWYSGQFAETCQFHVLFFLLLFLYQSVFCVFSRRAGRLVDDNPYLILRPS
jgi:hypothetical protein